MLGDLADARVRQLQELLGAVLFGLAYVPCDVGDGQPFPYFKPEPDLGHVVRNDRIENPVFRIFYRDTRIGQGFDADLARQLHDEGAFCHC
jgi:hypothetical protein